MVLDLFVSVGSGAPVFADQAFFNGFVGVGVVLFCRWSFVELVVVVGLAHG